MCRPASFSTPGNSTPVSSAANSLQTADSYSVSLRSAQDKTGELLSSNYDAHEPDMQISECLEKNPGYNRTNKMKPIFSGLPTEHTS